MWRRSSSTRLPAPTNTSLCRLTAKWVERNRELFNGVGTGPPWLSAAALLRTLRSSANEYSKPHGVGVATAAVRTDAFATLRSNTGSRCQLPRRCGTSSSTSSGSGSGSGRSNCSSGCSCACSSAAASGLKGGGVTGCNSSTLCARLEEPPPMGGELAAMRASSVPHACRKRRATATDPPPCSTRGRRAPQPTDPVHTRIV